MYKHFIGELLFGQVAAEGPYHLCLHPDNDTKKNFKSNVDLNKKQQKHFITSCSRRKGSQRIAELF